MRRVHPEMRRRARELRRPLTPTEQILWQRLRDRQAGGLKFRRQHPIGWYIADFYCAEAKLVIEIDGEIHASQVEYDQARTAWLESQGYRVVRYSNQQVRQDLDEVIADILMQCGKNTIQ